MSHLHTRCYDNYRENNQLVIKELVLAIVYDAEMPKDHTAGKGPHHGRSYVRANTTVFHFSLLVNQPGNVELSSVFRN